MDKQLRNTLITDGQTTTKHICTKVTDGQTTTKHIWTKVNYETHLD